MCDECQRSVVVVQNAPKPIGPYSAGVKAGHFVFTAGQLGIDPAVGELVPGGVQEETRQALKNVSAILEAAGTNLANVVKTTLFLRDIADFAVVNEVYGTFFTSEPPARSTFQVCALPKGAAIEIEAIAIVTCE